MLPRSDWQLLDRDLIRRQLDDTVQPRLQAELQEVRGSVEPPAARIAAERASHADLEALDAALEAMDSAGDDPGAAVAADLDLHRSLLAATHNELLGRMELFMETGLAERAMHRLLVKALKDLSGVRGDA